jgi:hypothetical protein
MRAGVAVELSAADRQHLAAIVSDRNSPQKHVWRAQIVLLTADGCGTAEIMRRTDTSKTTVWRSCMTDGVTRLLRDKTRPSRIPPLGAEVEQRIVARTLTDPPGETTHWTAGSMATASGISASAVQRIWRKHGLQPHRTRQFKLSNDPQFAAKLHEIVGLYVDPPAHAVVLSIDEKSQIQVLDRTQPGLPMKKGRGGTMTHDYKRHGTTTLFAALNVLDGAVIGRCSPASGVHPLPQRRRSRRSGRQAGPRHRRQLRRTQASKGSGLAGATSALDHPLHTDRRIIAQCRRGLLCQTGQAAPQRGVFRSVELQAAIARFLAETNANPRPFRWTKHPDQIIAAAKRGHQVLDSIH